MEEEFDRWNRIKKGLSKNDVAPAAFPKEGEVWLCAIGQNLGREQHGNPHDFSRPALVCKKFNNTMFWIIPLTTKQKSLDFYFNYTDPSGAPVAAILAQLRLMSIKRFQRNLYPLSEELRSEIRKRLRGFLS